MRAGQDCHSLKVPNSGLCIASTGVKMSLVRVWGFLNGART